jgi:hypothetical protein
MATLLPCRGPLWPVHRRQARERVAGAQIEQQRPALSRQHRHLQARPRDEGPHVADRQLAAPAHPPRVVQADDEAPEQRERPVAPVVVDALTATVEGSDLDEDTVTYTYAWTVDGVAAAYTEATLPVGAFVRGETWEVTVTPSDDEAAG